MICIEPQHPTRVFCSLRPSSQLTRAAILCTRSSLQTVDQYWGRSTYMSNMYDICVLPGPNTTYPYSKVGLVLVLGGAGHGATGAVQACGRWPFLGREEDGRAGPEMTVPGLLLRGCTSRTQSGEGSHATLLRGTGTLMLNAPCGSKRSKRHGKAPLRGVNSLGTDTWWMCTWR